MRQIIPIEFDESPLLVDSLELANVIAAYLSADADKLQSLRATLGIVEMSDVRGLRCPYPVARMRKMLRRLKHGERLVLLSDDPLARTDIPHALAISKNDLRQSITRDEFEAFLVEKNASD